MKNHARSIVLGLFAVFALAVAAPVFGCPVCFGDSDAPIVKGIEMSVLFMVIVTYGVILTGMTFAFLSYRRARRLATEQPAESEASVLMS